MPEKFAPMIVELIHTDIYTDDSIQNFPMYFYPAINIIQEKFNDTFASCSKVKL